jgi:hypothetical protein
MPRQLSFAVKGQEAEKNNDIIYTRADSIKGIGVVMFVENADHSKDPPFLWHELREGFEKHKFNYEKAGEPFRSIN